MDMVKTLFKKRMHENSNNEQFSINGFSLQKLCHIQAAVHDSLALVVYSNSTWPGVAMNLVLPKHGNIVVAGAQYFFQLCFAT